MTSKVKVGTSILLVRDTDQGVVGTFSWTLMWNTYASNPRNERSLPLITNLGTSYVYVRPHYQNKTKKKFIFLP